MISFNKILKLSKLFEIQKPLYKNYIDDIAFWIRPDGKTIEWECMMSHGSAVEDDPKWFGIQNFSEGDSLIPILKKGFIRVHHYIEEVGIIEFNFFGFTKRTKNLIFDHIIKLLEKFDLKGLKFELSDDSKNKHITITLDELWQIL